MEGISYFIHLFNSGGFVMYPLLLLSIITIAIAIERYHYYGVNRKPMKRLLERVDVAVKNQDWDAVKTACKEEPCALSRILEAGFVHEYDENSMRNALGEQVVIESSHYRRNTDYLSGIVTVSPLLGLLGTVTGMIGTFSILDNGGGTAGISGGVGEALIATATGLCVAILAFAFYTCFKQQLDATLTRIENCCITVINGKREQWRKQ